MRHSRCLIVPIGLFMACSQSISSTPDQLGAGGQTGTQSIGAGGTTQSGAGGISGAVSGGSPNTSGGADSTAASTSTGGRTAGSSGGGSTTGGLSAPGGASTTGGRTNTGGSANTGGRTSTGGVGGRTNTGGVASGGNSSTGGTTSNAGSAATGGVSTGGTTAACADREGSLEPSFPFPQNFRSPKCIYPLGACSADARIAYDRWKQELVVPAGNYQRVNRPDQEGGIVNSTVSEGIAYGMILAVFMDDQPLLDSLWQYSQQHLNGKGLMIWLIDPNGNPGLESSGQPASGSATDADEDMAWALALAAEKWESSSALGPYKTLAVDLIGRIYANEADTRFDMLNAGDSWGTTFAWNPSYFAPYEYRVFAKLDATHAEGWNKLIDKGYQALATSQNATSGLVPAWTDTNGNPAAAWSGGPTHYQYDAVRVPFRLAIDYCEYGEPRAAAILQKFTTFFAGIGAANIVDGYALDGTPQPEHTDPVGVQSALFVGAAGVGAMSTTNSSFVNAVYDRIVMQPDPLMLPVSYYYNLSWKVFTLLMMTGNLFEYGQHP